LTLFNQPKRAAGVGEILTHLGRACYETGDNIKKGYRNLKRF